MTRRIFMSSLLVPFAMRHTVPLSEGGSDSASNMQALQQEIDALKKDLREGFQEMRRPKPIGFTDAFVDGVNKLHQSTTALAEHLRVAEGFNLGPHLI